MNDDQEIDLMNLFSKLDRMVFILEQHRLRQIEENRAINIRLIALEGLFMEKIREEK